LVPVRRIDMKRIIICLLSVVMLVTMMLPADTALARGRGGGMPTANNETTIESPLTANFDYSVCSSCSRGLRISVTFTDKSAGGVKPYKYAWDFGDGSDSTRQNPRHSYAGDGTYNVTLTVTDKAGNVASKSETVTLNSASNVSKSPPPQASNGGKNQTALISDGTDTIETPFCTTTGDYTVCTDKADYGSGETVHISGSGFAPGARLTIKVTRPDGSVVTGDGSFAPWPTAYDAVVADLDGSFDYNYVLDGVQGEYLIEAIAGGEVLASCAFTDCWYTLKAFKFEDKDGNGVQNADEGPLQGWEFKLYVREWVGGPGGHWDWVLISTKTTNLTGYADFGTQLCGPKYKIVETRQDCWTCTNCAAAETPFCLSSDKIVMFANQPRCDDGDPCTIDTCENGTCVHTPIDCDYLDDWYEDGSTYTECDGNDVCTYQDMVYLDYECVEGNCVPTETDWRTDLISCQSCDDGDPCTIDTCENGTCVHIWAAPNATASSNSPVSQGATIYLYGGPAGMASYSWTGPSNWTSSDQNATRRNATTAMTGIYTLVVTNEYGCTDDATTNVVVTVPVTPAGGGGGGCPRTRYLTVDWEGCNTSRPLYSNDKLAVDLLGPSFDLTHSLFLGRGTHAPVVDERTYYLVVVRELEQIPTTPENTVALVVFNVTPAGAEFDRDILLTLGLNQTQLPANTLNVTMAYYDDVNGVWETLEYEAGGPNGVAEVTLSAPINHFSIYGVLADLGPAPQPAHFVAGGLTIVPSVEKISAFVTKTGEVVTISANVANDGGQEGTFDVVLKLNGQTVDTKTVTIGAGQSKLVIFTRSGLDYGEYDVDVAGLADEFTVSRTIAWWLIILLIVAFGLIIWGVLWGRKKRRKAQQET
jgi:PKD repeat protein